MLIAQARFQPITLDRCTFFDEIVTFWYLASKKFHNHSVIIHLVRLLRCETVKIWKIHWKLKYSESQYCFANISAMEARIFMKFYMVVNYYLLSLSLKFHGIPCTTARARVINAHTRDKTCTRAFTTRLRAFIHGSSWNLKLNLTR